MVALTVNAAEMKALVSYVTGLGGTSTAAARPKASGSTAPGPAKAAPAAPVETSKVASAASPPASAVAPSPAPAKAEPAAAREPSKVAAGNSAGDATTSAQGKAIFDSNGCSGCHGDGGGGGSGPALTRVASEYPPAKLTAVLRAPTAGMKAAGMVALTVNAADMKALVSYVTGLGGTSTSAAIPKAPSSSSPAEAKTGSSAPDGAPKTESRGQAIFKAHGCADCHGVNGVGGTAAASALAGTGKSIAPALLTTMLQHPTTRMQQGGMPPVSLGGDELKSLVAYVSSISASKSNSH